MNTTEEHEFTLKPEDIARLESALERTRPAFERPGIERYNVRVKHAGRRIRVIWDTQLGLVSVLCRQPVEGRAT